MKATLPGRIPKNPSEHLPRLSTRMETLRSPRRKSTNIYATASHVLEPGQGKNVDISHRPLAKGHTNLNLETKKDLFTHSFFCGIRAIMTDEITNIPICELRGFSCQNRIGSISRATDSRKRRRTNHVCFVPPGLIGRSSDFAAALFGSPRCFSVFLEDFLISKEDRRLTE